MNEKERHSSKSQTRNVYELRFEKLMMLMRIDRMLKKAVVTHKK